MSSDSSNDALERKKLMEDCLVLLVSLVLSEPRTTKQQQKMIGRLIGQIKKALT